MWHPFIGRGSSEMIGEGAFNGWRRVELQDDHLDPGRGALSQGNDGVCAHFGRGGAVADKRSQGKLPRWCATGRSVAAASEVLPLLEEGDDPS
jgi:hypothetical protein